MCKHPERARQDQRMSEEYKPGLVSVIIPTYNRAHLVKKAIDSVLSQTYKDFEIIVVDDGSIDNTEEVVRSFKDACIHYIRHKENRGGSAARNTGIKTSSGEYIAFLDSDDEWFPLKLQKQMNLFKRGYSNLGVVSCGSIRIDHKTLNVIQLRIPKYKGKMLNHLASHSPGPATPTAVVKRECFSFAGGFDEHLPSNQEPDLWIRIAHKYEFDFVPEPLVRITMNHDQITKNLLAKLQGRIRFFVKHENYLNGRYKAKLSYEIANGYCLIGNTKPSFKYFIRSLRYNPFYFKSYFCLLISLLGSKTYRNLRNAKKYLSTKY